MSLFQLVHIRRALDVTQAKLAQATGLSQKYISDLELGRRPISQAHVQTIADALGVEPAALTSKELTICTSPSGVVAIAGSR